jgi:predicted nucleic acid-binding protein
VPAFMPDSGCMVPTLVGLHPHHLRARAALTHYLGIGYSMTIAGHALLETYSVLTRMPFPLRIPPAEALRAIDVTFLSRGTVFAPTNAQHVRMLRDIVTDGIVGGRVYDAAIAACARLAGVDVILTFNERHFPQFASDQLAIVVP